MFDEKGQKIGTRGVNQDITEQKIAEDALAKSLDEKEMLLKEIHHRVKNNLMIISSLLNLQSRYIEDKDARDVFKESQNRAKSMAMIHERLYHSTDLKNIDFGDYIMSLTTDLYHTMVLDSDRIKLDIDVEDVKIDINNMVPLGLIVNELITNSMKYAFPNHKSGYIKIQLYREHEKITLVVSDNGIGLPEDVDYRKTNSLGLQLVKSLTDQIDGEIRLDKSQGTTFTIIFEEQNP
jgi:two-component sensor histidine kinase